MSEDYSDYRKWTEVECWEDQYYFQEHEEYKPDQLLEVFIHLLDKAKDRGLKNCYLKFSSHREPYDDWLGNPSVVACGYRLLSGDQKKDLEREDKIDTSPEAVDRRVTFQDETPKTSDCVLCLYCGDSLHDPEHGIFWKQTTGHYCEEQQIKDLQKKLDKQIGYKEDYRVSYMGAMDDWAKSEARFIEQRDSLVSVTKKLAKTEAKLAEIEGVDQS